jgi:dTDP-4-amino-4,6-dideoxygalactose transaminase
VAEVTLNLPIHQNLSEEDVGLIIRKIREFFDG